MTTAPLRLLIDGDALVANWRALAALGGGAACGAAVKADGYGLGAVEVVRRLSAAGCRDFFVATWAEAEALVSAGVVGDGIALSVLHGVRDEDMSVARAGIARPVLNTPAQVARWRAAGGGACDVMIDTGMNRLGLDAAEAQSGLLDALPIETLMSHLACADEDSAMNTRQRDAFAGIAGTIAARRYSLANSAGIGLGRDYAFDLTRPGLALYGGTPRADMAGLIRPVATPAAQILQRRTLRAGDTIGYGATYTAAHDVPVAIVNIGYADGYVRAFSNTGRAFADDAVLPVIGRVSMDLSALDISAASSLGEGDWVMFEADLSRAAQLSATSPYELLVRMGARFERRW